MKWFEYVLVFVSAFVLSFVFYMFTFHNIVQNETREAIYKGFAREGRGEFYLDVKTGKTEFRLFPCDCE